MDKIATIKKIRKAVDEQLEDSELCVCAACSMAKEIRSILEEDANG